MKRIRFLIIKDSPQMNLLLVETNRNTGGPEYSPPRRVRRHFIILFSLILQHFL